MRRHRFKIFGAIFLLGLLFAGRLLWSLSPLTAQGSPVVVKVVTGESMSQIAADLQSHHVLSSTLAFKIDLALFGSPIVRPGLYVIHQNSSHGAIRTALSAGPNANVLYLTPGMTVRQTWLQLATIKGAQYAKEFENLTVSTASHNSFGASSLEGLLGTGAYIVQPNETPTQLLSQMKQRFLDQLRRVGITPTTKMHGLNSYQLIIAASIVEKEGFYEKNMPQVARVILNRLKRGGGLQMDATILYALQADGVKVTPAMLQIESPYNTYKHPGLTPTPICQVGSAALHAIVSPPEGKWLYFVVVDKSGTEAFAVTYQEHLANIELARRRGL